VQEAADLTTALVAMQAVRGRFPTASAEEVLADLDLVEQLGRLVDGLRVAGAAQVEHLSRPILGSAGLAFQRGARDGVELVQQVARISHAEAGRRVGLGTAVAPRIGLLGDVLPGRFPSLTDAVGSGAIGVEAARLIVNTWKQVRPRADVDGVARMVDSLVQSAQSVDGEALREIVEYWVLALDPDGAEDKERKQRRNRALRIGETLDDGTTAVRLVMTPEDLALLKELLQSKRRNVKLVRTEPGSEETGPGLAPEWREQDGPASDPDAVDPEAADPRMKAQQDYDTITDALRLAVRAEAEGVDGTAVTHTTVITVTADEVESRRGQGWAPGIMAGLPMPVIERKACTEDVRLQVTGDGGEILYLSHAQRLFTAAQKLALTVRAGGRCEYPGCRVPHPYLEAHHVDWFQRDAGRTDIDNGIMLCSYHHHLIHAADSPVEIRRYEQDLWIVPKTWLGRPDHLHRRGTGPTRTPDFLRFAGRRRRAATLWDPPPD
jgi:hypothetical protein